MGASAAAAIVIKEKHIVAAFRQAGATTSTRAVAPSAIGVHERIAFSRLRRRAVLREATPGLYFLDEPSWEALRSLRHRAAMVMVLIGLAAFLGFLAFQAPFRR